MPFNFKNFLLVRAIFSACVMLYAASALSQTNQINSPEDAIQRFPKIKCGKGSSAYIESDLICALVEKHFLGTEDSMSILFLKGKRSGMIVSGAPSKVEGVVNSARRSASEPMTELSNESSKRWINSKGAMYLIKDSEGSSASVLMTNYKDTIESLNLRYDFEDSPITSELPRLQNSPPITSRVEGGVLSLFGIKFGEPLGFIECTKGYSSQLGLIYLSKDPKYRPCFKRSPVNDVAALMNGWAELVFPLGDRPNLGADWGVVLVDGRVEGMRFTTNGIYDQESNLASLRSKFGEPKSLIKSTIKNLTGAQFDSFTAIWSSKDFNATYLATNSKIDLGEVSVNSIVGQAVEDKWNAERKAKNPGRGL